MGPSRGGELTNSVFTLVELRQWASWTETGLEAFWRRAKQDGCFDRVVSLCLAANSFTTARRVIIRLLINANKGI